MKLMTAWRAPATPQPLSENTYMCAVAGAGERARGQRQGACGSSVLTRR
jgi:hypothetical protein